MKLLEIEKSTHVILSDLIFEDNFNYIFDFDNIHEATQHIDLKVFFCIIHIVRNYVSNSRNLSIFHNHFYFLKPFAPRADSLKAVFCRK